MTTSKIFQNPVSLSKNIFVVGSILASFGILLVTVGGSWDITNHLLNKPETFFSPPHALMYVGVAISLIGTVISFFGWKNSKELKTFFSVPLKIKLIGIFMLTGAGPFDFFWHSNFGLDGLLSPPHITLIFGMLLCGLGGAIGISRFLSTCSFKNKLPNFLNVLAILPVWLSASGIISSLSLPFSNTDFFEFNPEPLTAYVIASLGFPFLIAFSFMSLFKLGKHQFGLFSLMGGLFLLINGSTAIIPNFAIGDSILFYSMNFIPFVISDIVLRLSKSKITLFSIGGLLGSIFYMIYYPYIMYTFNEILLGKLVSPSLIYFVYFEIIQEVILFTIGPAILMGILGVGFSDFFSKKVLPNNVRSIQ